MNAALDYVIYFVGSGDAFFAGAALILAGTAMSWFVERRPLLLTRNLLVMIGGTLVSISAAPLDWWVYILLAAVTCGWLAIEWFNKGKARNFARGTTLVVWLMALAMELPYHFSPTLPALNNPTLFVIGDSVSAGMRENDEGTWPKLLVRDKGIRVRDFSRMGATVGSARKQAELMTDDAGLVLLEIGGNDLLGSTSPDQFEERLDLLLTDVCGRDRVVVMLELPLPPFANRFGMIQRTLARNHGVYLIPKRIFIDLLTTSGATVDGIHLTPKGQERMANAMWQQIGPAYASE